MPWFYLAHLVETLFLMKNNHYRKLLEFPFPLYLPVVADQNQSFAKQVQQKS